MDQEFERNIISITDEDGEEFVLEVLASVTYNGVEYLALTPADAEDEQEELEVSILKSVMEGEEPVLLAVQDDRELEAVYDLLMEEMFELGADEDDEDAEDAED